MKKISFINFNRFFVFSGIAISILKALNSCNNNDNKLLTHSVTEPSQPTDPPHSREPIFNEKIDRTNKEVRESTQKTIDIVKGDTLWDLSRKHGVSIDAVKEANGLIGDTIYAGKKTVPNPNRVLHDHAVPGCHLWRRYGEGVPDT